MGRVFLKLSFFLGDCRGQPMPMTLKSILEGVFASQKDRFLANDPLEFPRRFRRSEDREIAAFLSAALAYGRAGIIRRNLEALFSLMPEGPAAFVAGFDPGRDAGRLADFRHRFNSGEDVACLCWLLRRMQEQAGSLEGFFLAGDDAAARDIGSGLGSFARRALALDVSPLLGTRKLPGESTVRYFFPNVDKGSACKRLCMLMRWLCRPDDGIDLGLWKKVSTARLVVPLDTHVARISRLLGLSSRRSPDWKMAMEVTESLRRLDPNDPVKYDFALSHLGISEGCSGKKGETCVPCPVAGLCTVAPGRGDRGRIS
jgi:uncharacterized protein (TIGR02757 family)